VHPGRTFVCRSSQVSRRELLDTIIHEELHHRLWERAIGGNARALQRIASPDLEETYVRQATQRFLDAKGA
jgi:hypothetical protein